MRKKTNKLTKTIIGQGKNMLHSNSFAEFFPSGRGYQNEIMMMMTMILIIMLKNEDYANNANIKCRSLILSNAVCKISRKELMHMCICI